jgi:hypothetical protein
VDGHDIDLPLLQIYWSSTSPTPSTVITLDSAVIVPENIISEPSTSSKPNQHPYRFKIQHVKKSINSDSTLQLTRVFSCPQEGRDEWLSAINQALLEFEKGKARARRRRVLSSSPPRRSVRNMSLLSAATGDIAPNALFHRRNMSTGNAYVGIY